MRGRAIGERALRLIVAGLIAAFAWLAAGAAAGYEVSPIRFDFTIETGDESRTLRVRNTADRVITVQLAVYERTVHRDGSETRTPAPDDFLVFPPQGAIERGEVRTFRLQWNGPREFRNSRAYYVMIEQLPIDLRPSGDFQGMQFVTNFATVVHANPPGASADLRVVSAAAVENGASGRMARIVIANDGNGHAYLSDHEIALLDAGDGATAKTHTLSGSAIREAMTGTLVPPGGKREVMIVLPDFFAGEGVRAKVAKGAG